MKNTIQKIIPTLLIFYLILNVNCSTHIKLKDQCTCEQILYQYECKYGKICQFENDKCSTLSCDKIPLDNCLLNKKCANVNGKCVSFKSCSSHNVKTELDCENLHRDCFYNSFNGQCEDIKDIDLGSCSSQLTSLCIIANEGFCVLKNGKCQEMTSCNDVKQDELQCLFSFPACFPNKESGACDSYNQCSKVDEDLCLFAKERINGDDYLLCALTKKGCADFDPNIQTNMTCGPDSNFFYHWDGNACAKCYSFLMTILSIVILAMS